MQALQKTGWINGANVRIDVRWAAADPEAFRRHATELVALAPDIILASTSPSVAALQQASRVIPIVFANVTDPVGQGFVASLARPGGNATGFSIYEYGVAPKWLELSKRLLPVCGAWRCFAMPLSWQEADCWGRSKAWRPRLEWR